MKTNKYQEAVMELQTLNMPKEFEIPKEMDDHELVGHYAYVCVKARDSKDRMTKIYSPQVMQLSELDYVNQNKQVADGVFASLFGGSFQKIVMLHDPVLARKEAAEAAKTKKEAADAAAAAEAAEAAKTKKEAADAAKTKKEKA
jgi:hypothetical protein